MQKNELTTVKQNSYKMGNEAVQMLIDYFEFDNPLKEKIIQHELIERATV